MLMLETNSQQSIVQYSLLQQHLEAKLNVSKMHHLYVNQCTEKLTEPAFASYYQHVFDT